MTAYSESLADVNIADSVLFLGSGFSSGAKNIRNQHLPTGDQLKNSFARRLDIYPTEHDLPTLASEIASRPEFNLYKILSELFTVNELSKDQSDILSQKWLRIYTTNYDDAVEFAYIKTNRQFDSYVHDDEKPRKLANGSIIHLHGCIARASQENVHRQLVLDEASYARQYFERSAWRGEFHRDLKFCSACFFVGYSLKDYHIAALLLENPTFKGKIYFVVKEGEEDPIFANRIRPYGQILPIGTEGFAGFCRNYSPSTSPVSLHTMRAFRYIDPRKDRKTISLPTATEVFHLVTYGTFNYQRCVSTLPGNDYVVPRSDLVQGALEKVRSAKCLLIHSSLGNGKSIFLYILSHKLSEQGYKCFMCAAHPVLSEHEISLLKKIEKPVIIFDSYDTAVDFVPELDAIPNVKFIITIRSGLHYVRLHEIQSRLPSPMARVDLNGISTRDKEDFRSLLDKSGLHVDGFDLVIDKCGNFREIVLSLYKNRQISDRITSEIGPLLRDADVRKVFVTSHLLKWIGQPADAEFLQTVTKSDAYAVVSRFPEVTREIFNLDGDFVTVRSAMFSEYLIQNHFPAHDIVDCVNQMIVHAARRKPERYYQAILSSLMRYNILKSALENEPARMVLLTGLFEDMRSDEQINSEPLFWLQYSILKTDNDQLNEAEKFIRTAYARAAARAGFHTFQIDTYALRLLLLIEERNQEDSQVSRLDEIMQKMDKVRSIINEPSRRYHAIEVLMRIEPFVHSRISAIAAEERTALNYRLQSLLDSLVNLSQSERAETGSDKVVRSIRRTMVHLRT